MTVLTIGHSSHSIDDFIELLERHSIRAVVDVRSMPYSRRYPHFNRKVLKDALREHDISYAFLGRELGARTEDRSCYEDGRVQYRRLAQTHLFHTGLQKVVAGSKRRRVALMCAEKDPLDCHRAILVARELVAAGIDVDHIHSDGRVESHQDAIRRLIDRLGLPLQDFFRTSTDVVEEAYAEQEERIAYVEPAVEEQDQLRA